MNKGTHRVNDRDDAMAGRMLVRMADQMARFAGFQSSLTPAEQALVTREVDRARRER